MTTNKFYNETANLSVNIINITEYNNNGKLIGGWVSLPIKKSDWKDFLKTIGNPEEIAIHNCDSNIGLDDLEIGEYESIDKLNNLARRLSNISPYEIHIINALYKAIEDIEEALDCYESDNYIYYGCMTLEEVAKEYIKENYVIPKGLEDYIDYRLYARDMDIEGFYHATTYGTIKIL